MPLRPLDSTSLNGGINTPAAGTVTLLNGANFDSVIANTPGPIAVEFMNYSCMHCIRAQPIVEDLARSMSGRMTIFQVESHQSPELFRRFGVTGTPTFVMFKDGEEVGRGNSRITAFDIKNLISAPFRT